MEIANTNIGLHPWVLMHRLRDHIVSFDPDREVINAMITIEIQGTSRDIGVIIERTHDENIRHLWSARTIIFMDEESVDFEFQAMKKVSELLSK